MDKLDILVIASHPDDAELGCAGILASHIASGKRAGIVDLTRGEMGTRGTPALRLDEAKAASDVLGLSARENLGMADGFFANDPDHQRQVIEQIRRFRPEIVITNAIQDRHPDHARAASLVREAAFLSGLRKFETNWQGETQEAWRPSALYHFIQSQYLTPDLVVDITEFWETKMKAIKAYKSQFFDPESNQPETYISRKGFLDFVEARAREMGNAIGVTYGEGFLANQQIGVSSLFDLVS